MITIVAAALFAGSAIAQSSPVPAPTPPEDVVRISSNLVQIDASVVDRNGRPVRDLRPEDFRVFENGKERKISGITFVPGASSAVSGNTGVNNAALPSKLAPNQVRRTIAIVVDDITLSFTSTAYVRDVLRQFVDRQMQPGDLVAIVRSSAGVGALQQFTSDKSKLYMAIDNIRWNAAANGRVGAFAPVEARLDSDRPANGAFGRQRSFDNIQQENEELRQNIFTVGSLGALNYTIRGMDQMPGRKSVLMLSEGFRLYERDQNGGMTQDIVLDALRKVTDTANRSSVVVYTLDPRGLVPPADSDAQANGGFWRAGGMSDNVQHRDELLLDTQEGLRFLAEETGGVAVINRNNLSKGIREILDDQSYYLVAYEPDENNFDAKNVRFNRIELKVDRPGTSVRYRRGFFAVDNNSAQAGQKLQGAALIRDALFSPFAKNDLPIRFNALFNYDEKTGTYLRSLVHMNLSDLTLKALPDGRQQATFDIFAYAFGSNGNAEASLQKSYTITVKPEDLEKAKANGFVYNFVFPVTKAGAYQVRVVVRDRADDKVGSASQFIEIPDIKKDRLTLSSIVLDRGGSPASANAITSTAIRQFPVGSTVDYGAVAFNAKPDSAGRANLSSQLRIFRDGVVIFEGEPQSIEQGDQPSNAIAFMGTINLGTKLEPGDYVIETAISDANAGNPQYATSRQYVEFSVVR